MPTIEPIPDPITDLTADSAADPIHEATPYPCRLPRPGRVRLPRGLRSETGAATAEYAVATMAAVGFAGLLIVILRGDEVRGILTELVRSALSVG
jgi:hypothetical protein